MAFATAGFEDSRLTDIVGFGELIPPEIVQGLKRSEICAGRWSRDVEMIETNEEDGPLDTEGETRKKFDYCWCLHDYCQEHWAMQFLHERISNITGIPNIERFSEQKVRHTNDIHTLLHRLSCTQIQINHHNDHKLNNPTNQPPRVNQKQHHSL